MDECLDEYIETANKSVKLLRELLADIKAHHERCNVVKTAGTTASVTGGLITIGAIVAAPFTGGASIVALTGFGAATALTGAAANLGTDTVDVIWSQKYQAELLAIDIRLAAVGRRFNEYLEQIGAEAARLFKKNGNEEEALKMALELIMDTGKTFLKQHEVTDMAVKIGQVTGSTLLRNGGQAWKGMRVNSNSLITVFSKLGLDVSKRAAFNVVKGATAIFSVASIFSDIKSLVNSLDNDHPVVEPVENQIKKITKLLNDLKELRDSFN